MRLKQSRTLFGALSLVALSACKSGPLVDVCISYPPSGGFVCVDKQQQAYSVPYEKSEKYVAFNPEDARALIEACGLKGKVKSQAHDYLDRVEMIVESLK